MGIIKNICLRVALNREQRLVIWNALQYSDHAYRRHGDVDSAVITSTVIAQTEKQFGVSEKNFSKEEVNAILDEFIRRVKQDRQKEIDDAREAGRQEAISEMLDNIKHGRGLVIGEIVEMEETPEEKQENNDVSDSEPSTASNASEEQEKDQAQDAGEQ